MTDWSDETLRPLDELARIAFPEGSGVTADTLKRRARQGKLVVYKPGKAFLSTLANVRAMIESTRTGPPATGPTQNELANLRLDRALEMAEEKRAEEEWERKYNAQQGGPKAAPWQ